MKGDYLTDHGYHYDFGCRPMCSSCCDPEWNSFNGHTRSCNERWEECQQTRRAIDKLRRREQMFTHRYIVLGITEGGYVDRIEGLRGTDPRVVCERALDKQIVNGNLYKQLILISIGRDGEIGEGLQVQLHRIEPTPPVPQPTYTLQPVQTYFG